MFTSHSGQQLPRQWSKRSVPQGSSGSSQEDKLMADGGLDSWASTDMNLSQMFWKSSPVVQGQTGGLRADRHEDADRLVLGAFY